MLTLVHLYPVEDHFVIPRSDDSLYFEVSEKHFSMELAMLIRIGFDKSLRVKDPHTNVQSMSNIDSQKDT